MKTYKKILLIVMAIFSAIVYIIIVKNKNTKNTSHLNLASYPVKTMDPIFCNDNNSAAHICTIYESLFQYNPFKKKLEPCLASKMPTINKNVITIKIKKDIKFHDNKCFPNGKGRELRAKDVRFSIMRNADPKLESKGFWIIDNKIVGLNDWRESQKNKKITDYSQNISGLKIVDDYTLQITLSKSLDRFVQILSTPFFSIVPKEAYDYYGLDLTNNPVGTGPFKLVHYNPSTNKMSYIRNETYRKSKLINSFKGSILNKKTTLKLKNRYKPYLEKKLPLVDKITFYIVQTHSEMWDKFKNGEIDILDSVSINDTQLFNESGSLAKQYKDKGIYLQKFNNLETCYIVFNLENKLFKDPTSKNKKIVNQFRRAISLGFDRVAFNNKFYRKSATVAQSAIPPGIAEYQENYMNRFNVYDLERANQILDNLGYTEYINSKDVKYRKGLDITIDILSGGQHKNEALFFKECMKHIGINIVIKTNIHTSLDEKILNGNFMLAYKCLNLNYLDAEYILQIGYSNLIPPKGCNLSRYHNERYDELFNKILYMNKSPVRTKLCRKLNRMLGDKVVAIFINHKNRINAYHPWTTSAWSYNNYDYIKYICINNSKKKYFENKKI